MTQDEGKPDVPESDRRLFEVLRIAAAMCFIGHGAFGIITKKAWLAYFAVVGIGPDLGYFFMPIIGVIDILLGLSVLIRPTKAALAYMTFWAVWTALLRPLAGQGFAEFLERAGNYGVPLVLLLIGLRAFPAGGWLARVTPQALDGNSTHRIAGLLRVTTATLLLGHGILAATGKPLLVKQLAAIGVGDGGASTLGLAVGQGWLEIALAVAVLSFPGWPVLLLTFVWKVATESLFPLTGDHMWEFIERGGSYGAPLASILLVGAAPHAQRSPSFWPPKPSPRRHPAPTGAHPVREQPST